MTLDEAIKDSETISKESQRVIDTGIVFDDVTIDELYCDDTEVIEEQLASYQKTAENYRQLAEWLKELKVYKERIPSYEAGYNDAKREIALSGEYERAYERGKADAQMARWIPVSEKLPEDGQYVLFCDIDDDIMIGYHVKGRPDTHFSQDGTYEDIKNVRAWMPRPKPYKPD